MNKCAGIFIYTCLIRPACHRNEDVYKIIFCVVFIVKQETFKPWFSQWCISMRWVLGGSHGYVSPVEAWGPSIMVSVIVAMCNFRCEKGQRWFFKNLFVLRKFLFIRLHESVCEIWKWQTEISLVKNIMWVKLLSGSWLCKNQNVKVISLPFITWEKEWKSVSWLRND